MAQNKQDIWSIAALTAMVTGSLLLILIPVEFFNDGPPNDFAKSTFFLLGFGLLSSLLAFKLPLAGRSLLRGYYVFFILSCVVLSVAALRDTVSVVTAVLFLAPVFICAAIVRELRGRRNTENGSPL